MEKRYLIEEDFIYKGFRCVVIGTALGHRCGYVGLPRGHKYYGEDYDDIPVECHGGLTYGRDNPNYPVANNEGLYWIGFDCAHCDDSKDYELLKVLGATEKENPFFFDRPCDSGHRWSKEEVIEELKRIVDQLKTDPNYPVLS